MTSAVRLTSSPDRDLGRGKLGGSFQLAALCILKQAAPTDDPDGNGERKNEMIPNALVH
jgi:hypothetical protein